MKTAIVFAGQGAQTPGMGKELYEAYSAAREVYAQATREYQRVSGETLTLEEICFSLSAEELNVTARAQPAIFTMAMAGLAAVKSELPELAITDAAGFSLGECSALCGAGVLSFDDTMELILRRGAAMARACEETDGAMMAILGVEAALCEEVCDSMRGEGVLLAVNYNCPGQTVIAGEAALVEAAAEQLRERGALRAVRLATQGAFHTPLMNRGRELFVPQIEKFTYRAPALRLWSDVTGEPILAITPTYLGTQMTSPVRWSTIVENMLADGVELFVELGPGKVLSGLIRKISRSAKVVNIGSLQDVEKLKSIFNLDKMSRL